jgi:hypothetical protein
MTEVSTVRLYLLRATYLFVTVGQLATFWPKTLHHTSEWALRYGDTNAILAGMTVLMALGVRYPLKMLPLLLFELTWKSLWLVAIYVPLWRAGMVDDATAESRFAVGLGVVICAIAIPWTYAYRQYVVAAGDRWTSG